jgi:hypothetical protein
MKSGKIKGRIQLPDITDPKDLVTKEYVDKSQSYTNEDLTPVTIGGIEEGSSFDNVPYDTMWDDLLYPFIAPTFDSFTFGWTTPLEVGDLTPADPLATWSTTTSQYVEPGTLFIRSITGGAVDLATDLDDDGSEQLTFAPITKTYNTNHVFVINGDDTEATPFGTNYTVDWQWRNYYGNSTDNILDESDVLLLQQSELTDTFTKTYSLDATGYKYICYPVSFGTATNFKDISTGFMIPFEPAYAIDITNGYGILTSYNIHRSTNIMGSSLQITVS